MALHKVCSELGQRLGWDKDDVKAVRETEGMFKPNDEKLKETLDWVEEEHHAIVFLYKADKQKRSKLIEEMENDILQQKRYFHQNCVQHVRCICMLEKQVYQSDANDGIASTTITRSSRRMAITRARKWSALLQWGRHGQDRRALVF